MIIRFPSLSRLTSFWALSAALITALPHGARAQEETPNKELSDKVSEQLNGPIKAASDAEKYDEVVRLIDKILPTTGPNSYDRAILSVEKAQTLFKLNIYEPAIEPLETALRLADSYNYLDAHVRLDLVETLGKLCAQEGGNNKASAETRRLYSNKAIFYFHRYQKDAKKPNPDYVYVTAAILFGEATEIADKVDTTLLKQAQAEVDYGLLVSIKPKVDFYILSLAIAQQMGDQQRAADLLEFLLKQTPNKKDYWQQLAMTYVTMQNEVRAILTFERAQTYGFMNTPRDNYNVVGMYFNVGQFTKASELLEVGLRNGAIENDQKNWETLADSYQQLHKIDKAIATLKDASKQFPKSGAIDYRIGTLYYSIDKSAEAYGYLKSAVKKGVDKPASAYVFIAYLGFELKKMDEALEAAENAIKADPNSREAKQMRDTLRAAIQEREVKKNRL